jgi:hypothetical protein
LPKCRTVLDSRGYTPPAVQKTALDDRSRSIEYGTEITKALLKMQEKSSKIFNCDQGPQLNISTR